MQSHDNADLRVGKRPDAKRHFIFSVESYSACEEVTISCHDNSWDNLSHCQRLQVATKALRKHRSFAEWRIIHVYEECLPEL